MDPRILCRATGFAVAACITLYGQQAHLEHIAADFREQLEQVFVAAPPPATGAADDEPTGRYSTISYPKPVAAVASSSDLSWLEGQTDDDGLRFVWRPRRTSTG